MATHYYDKIGVAVIKLEKGDLKVGDKVKMVGKDGNEFEQEITSMQKEHINIDIAKSGYEFGVKVEKPLKTPSPITKA